MEKPTIQVVGEDGNVFLVLGKASKALKRANEWEKAEEMAKRVTDSGSYDDALTIIQEYVDFE